MRFKPHAVDAVRRRDDFDVEETELRSQKLIRSSDG